MNRTSKGLWDSHFFELKKMLTFLLVLPVIISKGVGHRQYRRSCGDGVFCPSYSEGGEVMCCRGEVLVKEGGLFFERNCCTVDQWLEGEVRLRGEVQWLEEEGEGKEGGAKKDENQGELLSLSKAVFQGEGGLVEGREVQSFLYGKSGLGGNQGSKEPGNQNKSDLGSITINLEDVTVGQEVSKAANQVRTEEYQGACSQGQLLE